MKYFELEATCYLKRTLWNCSSGEFIGNLINHTMLEDEELSKIHKGTGFKKYGFSNFFPVERDFIYKEDKIYTFYVRSFNKKFLEKLQSGLDKQKHEHIIVLKTSLKQRETGHILELKTLNPAVGKLKSVETEDNKKYLTRDMDSLFVIERIEKNLREKYKAIFNEDIKNESNMINLMEFVNKKPIVTNYKNIKLLGNLMKFKVNNDEISQKLAAVAIVTGILEKNTVAACGFCNVTESIGG